MKRKLREPLTGYEFLNEPSPYQDFWDAAMFPVRMARLQRDVERNERLLKRLKRRRKKRNKP